MKTRECKSSAINTGSSKCPIDWGKVRGAILVEPGTILNDFTKEKLEEMCHADRPSRIYPIVGFVEYAKNGGEAQTSAIGYGSSEYNGISPQTDTFTLPRFDETLNAALIKGADKRWDVYFFDDKHIYGYNDGKNLVGIPMCTVYPTATQFSTSSNKSSLTVSFSYEDIEDALLHLDFAEIDYVAFKNLKGLTEVKLEKTGVGTDYKVIEVKGGYDITPLVGAAIAKAPTVTLVGATAATFEGGVLKITGDTPKLAKPSVLFTNQVKGIEGV